MSTFIAYVNALTFTEALLVAFIFLCLFLMWWSHETAAREACES